MKGSFRYDSLETLDDAPLLEGSLVSPGKLSLELRFQLAHLRLICTFFDLLWVLLLLQLAVVCFV